MATDRRDGKDGEANSKRFIHEMGEVGGNKYKNDARLSQLNATRRCTINTNK